MGGHSVTLITFLHRLCLSLYYFALIFELINEDTLYICMRDKTLVFGNLRIRILEILWFTAKYQQNR